MFITHIEIQKTREIGSGTKLLFTFLSLRSSDMRRERHTISFYADFSIWTPPHAAHFMDLNWSRQGETENRLPSSRLESQLFHLEFKSQLFFFQIPKSSALPGITSFTSPVSFSIWGFYWDISDCHIRPAHAWTPALNVCT